MTPVDRVQELEEVVRLLQLENDRLSEQAEDNLLLGQIGERLATAGDRAELLAAMLEQISLLKDIPFCACCSATATGAPAAAGARIEAVYASFSHDPVGLGTVLAVSPALYARAASGAVFLEAGHCAPIGLDAALEGSSFEARSILLASAKTTYATTPLFLFASNRPAEALRDSSRILVRAVEMAAARLDTLFLVESLAHLNRALDEKVEERTAALAASEKRFRNLFASMQEGFALHELLLDEEGNPADYRFLEINPAFEALTSLSSESVLGRTASEVLGSVDPLLLSHAAEVVRSGQPSMIPDYPVSEGRIAEVRLYHPQGLQFALLLLEVTQRRRAEKERARLEGQYRHSQKMEAVGRLAGGVAHDFNNILTAVFGYCELLSLKISPSSAAARDVSELRASAERAASLTQQLLAFSRKQVLQPRPVELAEIVRGIRPMLGRLIGEDVSIEFEFSPETGLINADPGQIQQVILNLAVNARDAMPDGGVLTISTKNLDCGEDYVLEHHVLTPGPYVVLTVSDTGCGMDARTRSHLFEPFFTTKEAGKGTGLGLATVHGIVNQSGGHIWVYSEPGQGTAFRIYFPRLPHPGEEIPRQEESEEASGGSETILVVEDSREVRQLVCRVLSEKGYRILEAATGEEALDLAQAETGRIDLLLTDVVIPGMNGRRLSERLATSRPAIKVLFMSGYTANLIVHHGVLDKGLNFLPKPFGPATLARKVREVLDKS
ncbi:MAG: Sensor histidine kinase RcsC [Thermoanaerobaculia bacterium]|nr:Sensor histidine kinase RcsC [Thermoanaerobaculia bacterium]